ncbi:hypothetical protein [Aeromonas hydrophila]|uniref:hypothetical protein n=1 Tax=Aeromonas hydrophila TaxID=644 RepID=UPI00111574F3|nr:hypothetical protein [Aeromonas hydrophila]
MSSLIGSLPVQRNSQQDKGSGSLDTKLIAVKTPAASARCNCAAPGVGTLLRLWRVTSSPPFVATEISSHDRAAISAILLRTLLTLFYIGKSALFSGCRLDWKQLFSGAAGGRTPYYPASSAPVNQSLDINQLNIY